MEEPSFEVPTFGQIENFSDPADCVTPSETQCMFTSECVWCIDKKHKKSSQCVWYKNIESLSHRWKCDNEATSEDEEDFDFEPFSEEEVEGKENTVTITLNTEDYEGMSNSGDYTLNIIFLIIHFVFLHKLHHAHEDQKKPLAPASIPAGSLTYEYAPVPPQSNSLN
mmetsp:Transcript_26742/g.40805  ORF Transcript_26742/g.40805 Transcript_26742/m.40805 type:complete len:167 (+) Transcript_26742:539-1039(+)